MEKIIKCMFGLLARGMGQYTEMTLDEIILGFIAWGVTIGTISLTFKVLKHYFG